MLAEVVVTSTVVLTTLIGLYITFNKLYKNYNIRSAYYDIDGVYAIKNMNSILLDSGELNEIIKDINVTGISSIKGIIVKEGNNIICNYGNKEGSQKCDNLKSNYSIQNLYLSTYDITAINSLIGKVQNTTFKDYLNFVKNYYDLNQVYTPPKSKIEDDNAKKYNYLFIIEYTKNDDKNYYASLGLGWYIWIKN